MPGRRCAAVADIHVAVDELAQLVRGTVTIGTVTVAQRRHPVAARRFPPANIRTSKSRSAQTVPTRSSRSVRTGRLDAAIAVGRALTSVPEGLDVEVVTDEAIEAVVGHGPIALASRKTLIRLAELADRPLIALPVGAGIRHQVRRSRAPERGFRHPDRLRGQHTAGTRRPRRARARASRSCPRRSRGPRPSLHATDDRSRSCVDGSCWPGGQAAR